MKQAKRVSVKYPNHLTERDLICILLSELASTKARVMYSEAMLCKLNNFSVATAQKELKTCRKAAFDELNLVLKEWQQG